MEELFGKDEAEAVDDSDDDDDEDDGGSSELRRVVAGPPAMPAALVPVGAARSVGSGPPSSAGTGPAEVEQLLRELFAIYDPVKDQDLSEYLERITRLVLALKTLGHSVSAADLERITMKAEIFKESFELVGSDPKSLVRSLRERFARLALDEGLGEQERSMQVGCIGELILGLGGKESSASDKLFSTPSVEDGAVGTMETLCT